ncbi:MAG: hypothetical protein EAZ92_08640 [Candidatus Kapaibacterium sp.]|nr:MAG: hypothetical protein EAZ92_08640 [Candidatus Kapabacteria bacterium]
MSFWRNIFAWSISLLIAAMSLRAENDAANDVVNDVVNDVISGAGEIPRSALGINAYVMAQGGINRTLNALTRTEFAFSPIPAFGVEGTYSLNRFDEGRFILALGYQPYATRSVSSDPFSGRPVSDFQITTNFSYLVASVGMNFHRVAGLPSVGFLIRAGLPVQQSYTSTVDVFEVQGEAKLSTGDVKSYTIPSKRAEPVLEALLDIVPAEWSFVEGQKLSIVLQAGLVINGLVRFLPLTSIPPYYNIIGQDPLAGLRTYNVQPVSFSIGVRYSFPRIFTFE